MKFGLEIFEIEYMAYPEVTIVEKEIKLLEDIWNLKQEWDEQWEMWKDIRMADLDCEEMDDKALDFQTSYKGFDRDVRDWQIYNFIMTELDKFRKTIPLIMDLRDPAMRDRHWKELRYEVKVDFDETSDEFNLEKIFSLNLLNHEEKINELAENARKQLKIEIALEEIRRSWEDDPVTDL
jgi:dynein heavy chain